MTAWCVLQRHPFFAGMDWEHLYSTQPPFRPSVAHELDTQVRAAVTCTICQLTTSRHHRILLSNQTSRVDANPFIAVSGSKIVMPCVQNFEVFEEDPNSSRGGRSTRRADPHFIGYTFKNWEVTAAVRGAAAESGAAHKPHHHVVNK